QAVQLGPERVSALTDLAWILATTADDNVRTPSEALSLAERAVELTDRRDARALDVLGAAYASAGFFERALEAADAARRVAADGPITSAIEERRELYRRRQPYRVSPGP